MTQKFERYGFWAFSFIILACLYAQTSHYNTMDRRPAKVSNYISKYKYLSVELNQQTDIPVPIILAVAGLESNWGSSELAKNANNHFGLKIKDDWKGLEYCKETEEYAYGVSYEVYDCFRKYYLIRESYQDFGRFLASRSHYKSALNTPSWNFSGWAEGLQQGGYATDPDYAQKIINLIEKYRLDEIE